MMVSNAKYERQHPKVNKNDTDSDFNMDVSHFEIPRYEELKFLRLESTEE